MPTMVKERATTIISLDNNRNDMAAKIGASILIAVIKYGIKASRIVIGRSFNKLSVTGQLYPYSRIIEIRKKK